MGSFFAWGLAWSSATPVSVTYPEPDYITPTGSPAAQTGMDVFLPPISGIAPSGAAIGVLTPIANPNSPITFAGTNFDSSLYPIFYAQSTSSDQVQVEETTSIRQLTVSGNTGAWAIPPTLPQGAGILTWLHTTAGVGKPVIINKSQAWWLQAIAPDSATGTNSALPGDTIGVYGLNLTKPIPTISGSVAVGTGSKTFTLAAGLSSTNVASPMGVFAVPNGALITQGNFVQGTVTSYNSGSGVLVISSTSSLGSGTYTGWNVYTTGYTWIWLVCSGQSGFVSATLAKPYCVQFPLPSVVGSHTLAQGDTVDVYVTSSAGGNKYGWSKCPQQINVYTALSQLGKDYTLSNQTMGAPSGTSDLGTFNTKVAAITTSGTITLQSNQTYKLSGPVSLAAKSISIQTDGAGSATIIPSSFSGTTFFDPASNTKYGQLKNITFDTKYCTVSNAANNGSGLIRLTVSSTTNLTTGTQVTISGILGTTEANITCTITVIDGTHLDLQGSTFTHAYTSGGTVSAVVTTAGCMLPRMLDCVGSTLGSMCPIDWTGQANGFMLRTTLTGGGVSTDTNFAGIVNTGTFNTWVIDGCTFHGNGASCDAAILGSPTLGAVCNNCTFDKTDGNITGTFRGRIFVGYGQVSNIIFDGVNSSMATFDGDGGGEQILFHTTAQEIAYGAVTGYSTTTPTTAVSNLTLADITGFNPIHATTCFITNGTGLGQTGRVGLVTTGTLTSGTLSLDVLFPVALDGTTTAVFCQSASRAIITNSQISAGSTLPADTATCAISPYTSVAELYVDNVNCVKFEYGVQVVAVNRQEYNNGGTGTNPAPQMSTLFRNISMSGCNKHFRISGGVNSDILGMVVDNTNATSANVADLHFSHDPGCLIVHGNSVYSGAPNGLWSGPGGVGRELSWNTTLIGNSTDNYHGSNAGSLTLSELGTSTHLLFTGA